MTENDRRILARACRVYWHEYTISPDGKSLSSCLCGNTGMSVRGICASSNPTFTTPDDWEMVRVKVVVPNLDEYAGGSSVSLWSWLLNSPQDCCWDVAQWIKSRPDLFPWVREMEVK